MSREFDGTSYYDWPGWVFSNSPCFSAWVQLGGSGSFRSVIGRWGASELFDTWAALFTHQTGDKLVMHVSNGVAHDVTGATSVSLNTWHLVGGQYDGTDITVWLDGVLDGTTNAPGMSLLGGGVSYVGFTPRTLPWLGLIEDLAYWSRGLTAEEWQSLYEGTSPSRLNSWDPLGNPRLMSHWPLWGQYSDEPSIASFDTLLENGSLGGADPSQRVGSPWSVAG